MALTLYWYPKCSTCRNAKKWLEANNLEFTAIHIVDNPPSAASLQEMIEIGDVPATKFFNTSGKKYRELNLKDEIKDASVEKMVTILASDGMLIKRPIVTNGDNVTVGFKEDEFVETWLQK